MSSFPSDIFMFYLSSPYNSTINSIIVSRHVAAEREKYKYRKLCDEETFPPDGKEGHWYSCDKETVSNHSNKCIEHICPDCFTGGQGEYCIAHNCVDCRAKGLKECLSYTKKYNVCIKMRELEEEEKEKKKEKEQYCVFCNNEAIQGRRICIEHACPDCINEELNQKGLTQGQNHKGMYCHMHKCLDNCSCDTDKNRSYRSNILHCHLCYAQRLEGYHACLECSCPACIVGGNGILCARHRCTIYSCNKAKSESMTTCFNHQI